MFCNVSAQHEMCERKHFPLWLCLPGKHAAWIRLVYPHPTPTSISHSPRGFNYGLPSPLISTSRPLILNAQHTHTDTHAADSHMFHVECKHNAEVSHVSATCVKGASDKVPFHHSYSSFPIRFRASYLEPHGIFYD